MNKEQAKELFKRDEFHATLVVDDDIIKAIDWRPKVGGNLAMRFYIDLAKGNFIVTGDAYDAVFSWYNSFTLKNLRDFVNNPEYVAEKMRAGKRYTYDDDDVKEDLRAIKEEMWENFDGELNFEKDKEDLERILSGDYWDGDIEYYNDRPPIFSEFALELLTKYTENDEGQLYDLGRRTNFRIYQWCVGFAMAYDELLLEEEFKMM